MQYSTQNMQVQTITSTFEYSQAPKVPSMIIFCTVRQKYLDEK